MDLDIYSVRDYRNVLTQKIIRTLRFLKLFVLGTKNVIVMDVE